MKEEIKINLDNPRQLEKLFRENKARFKSAFEQLYPEIQDNLTAQVWYERLNYGSGEISWGTRKELVVVAVLSLLAGLIAKIPDIASLDPDFFYPRNVSFIVFPILAAYFAWKQSLELKKMLIIFAVILASVVYINFLPGDDSSHTFVLAGIHLPFFIWSILGFTFTGKFKNYPARIDFLRYNGDLVVMATVMVIAGGILSGVTIGLFELINIRIEDFYFRNIAIWGLAAIPVIGTFLVQTNPQLVKNVSPVIAKVFTPLVLIMLVVYLIAIAYTGKDPYNDREFLLIFNVLLIGVMAIILFSVAESSKRTANGFSTTLVFLLSVVTILVNGIALSAIIFRITEWGITPNRLAVLGSNLLILVHLVTVSYRLFNALRSKNGMDNVEDSIAAYLPVYSAWTLIVTFLFPVMFGFI